jgi:hypothetical protein
MKVGITAGARLLAAAAMLISLVGMTAVPASAVDDYFYVPTSDLYRAGAAEFIDYGPGVPGNGESNDDYVHVWDNRADGHGVKAYAWIDGQYLGSKYNGNGDDTKVIWDPFGNVTAWQDIGLKVCLVDGTNDPTPSYCGWDTQESYDG